MTRILASDIGGTNARFALFAPGPGGLELLDRAQLSSRAAGSFPELLAGLRALGPQWAPGGCALAVLAVAGPVRGGVRCDPPNLDWDVDVSDPAALGLPRTLLVNDFLAQACAALTGVMDRAEVVLPGEADPDGTVAVIGAGTGLGKAALVPDGRGGRVPMPSEGGHALFPFAGEREFALQRFLMRRTGRAQVIGDMVVSGPGLAALHAFLGGGEQTPEAVGAGLDRHPETMDWAARLYGRACRNFALETLALGGVVVCGSVAARNPALMHHEAFAREFRDGGAQSALLGRIPVFLNRDADSGLWGAAHLGADALGLAGAYK